MPSCVAHVQQALASLPGVTDVAVNLATGKASLTYDAGRPAWMTCSAPSPMPATGCR